MKIFGWSRASRRALPVGDVAHYALRKYHKTFADLARYDRGEQSVQ